MKRKNLYPDLRAEMARRGETHKDLAKLLFLDTSAISRRLSGEIEWSIGEIETICNYYKKNYYELFVKNEEVK